MVHLPASVLAKPMRPPPEPLPMAPWNWLSPVFDPLSVKVFVPVVCDAILVKVLLLL